MSGGKSRNREASTDVGGQPTDGNPTEAPRFSDSHGRKIRVATVQNSDPTPRDRGDSVDRRRQGNSQLGQRCVTDVDAGAPTAKAESIKQKQEPPP